MIQKSDRICYYLTEGLLRCLMFALFFGFIFSKTRGNRLTLKDLKIILAKSKRVNYL